MRLKWNAALLAMVMAVGTVWGEGENPPVSPLMPLEAEISGVLKSLGDHDYKAREMASQKLLEWGSAQPKRLLALIPETDMDLEVQDRYQDLRRRIPLETMRRRMLHRAGNDEGWRSSVEALFDAPLLRSVQDFASRVSRMEGIEPEFIEQMEWMFTNEIRSTKWRLKALATLEKEQSMVPQIEKRLENPSPGARISAIHALRQLGEKSSAPQIAKLLGDSNIMVKSCALEALGQLGEKSTAFQIAKHLEEEDVDVKIAALQALGNLGEGSVVPQIAKLLEDSHIEVQRSAIRALGFLGEESLAPQLARLLKDPDLRYDATVALGWLGNDSVAPQISKFLKDKDPSMRVAARVALERLDALDALSHPLEQLDALGHPGAKSVAELVKLLEDQNIYVRGSAIEVLGYLREKSVAPELVKLLEDQNTHVKASAIKALGHLREKSVAPHLLKLLNDRDSEVRCVVIIALGRLGDDSVVPQISKLLNDPDLDIRVTARRALKKLGAAPASPQGPGLAEAGHAPTEMEHRQRCTRESLGRQVLQLAGKEDKILRAAAEAVLDEPNSSVAVRDLLDCIENREELAGSLIPLIIGFLEDTAASVRKEAANVLFSKINEDEESVAPHLIKLLKDPMIKLLEDPNKETRIIAVRAMIRFDEKSAVPQIAKLLGDPDMKVRQMATHALRQLDVDPEGPERK